MRASTMAEFWTRCGELRGTTFRGLTVTFGYEFGEASFDGAKWNFTLDEGVRR